MKSSQCETYNSSKLLVDSLQHKYFLFPSLFSLVFPMFRLFIMLLRSSMCQSLSHFGLNSSSFVSATQTNMRVIRSVKKCVYGIFRSQEFFPLENISNVPLLLPLPTPTLAHTHIFFTLKHTQLSQEDI